MKQTDLSAWRRTALAAAFTVAAWAPVTGTQAQPQPPVAGGWSQASVTDAGVLEAARAAVAQLPGGGTLAKVTLAERQVVAGLNYHLMIDLAGGAQWDVTVWRKLDGTYQLTGSNRIGPAPKPVLTMMSSGLRLDTAPGIGEAIPFGTPRDEVVAALAFRGKAEISTNSDCPAGPLGFAQWRDGLSLLFQDGKFQGWSMDTRTLGVKTDSGLRIGMTMPVLRTKTRFTIETSTLGEEFTTADNLSGTVTSRGPKGRVDAIWAGIDCVFR